MLRRQAPWIPCSLRCFPSFPHFSLFWCFEPQRSSESFRTFQGPDPDGWRGSWSWWGRCGFWACGCERGVTVWDVKLAAAFLFTTQVNLLTTVSNVSLPARYHRPGSPLPLSPSCLFWSLFNKLHCNLGFILFLTWLMFSPQLLLCVWMSRVRLPFSATSSPRDHRPFRSLTKHWDQIPVGTFYTPTVGGGLVWWSSWFLFLTQTQWLCSKLMLFGSRNHRLCGEPQFGAQSARLWDVSNEMVVWCHYHHLYKGGFF